MGPEKLRARILQGRKRLRASESLSGKVDINRNTGTKVCVFWIGEGSELSSAKSESVQWDDSASFSPQLCSSFIQQVRPEFGEPKTGINQDQKTRMELNKAIACATKNLRVCLERVAECQAKSTLPEIAYLLVEKTWLNVLQDEFKKPYMEKLCQFIRQEANGKLPIYPPMAQIFHALNASPLDKVKVVIIGQDPYDGPRQATGLCFSVPEGEKIPSSLLNIYKEVQQDMGCTMPSHGNLERWVHQGVLLLNTVLTVRESHPNSHARKGWEPFTDAVVRCVSQQRSGIVFLLWGDSAKEKVRLIKGKGHHILLAPHPAGPSAIMGFFNCRHFSQTNELLKKSGRHPIDWQI